MERKEQYLRKISYIVDKLSELPPYDENEYYMESLLYRLHTSIDALMDIIAMMVKGLGKEVGDDYSNIDRLIELGIIDNTFGEKLKKLNGLRNIIVHKYDKVEYNIIKECLDEILETIFNFIKVAKDVLQKIFG